MIDVLAEMLGIGPRYMSGFITGVIFTLVAVCIVMAYGHAVRNLEGTE